MGVGPIKMVICDCEERSQGIPLGPRIMQIDQNCKTPVPTRAPRHTCLFGCCNVQEALMTSVIREYEVLRERGKSVLRSLFKAGDVDGDGKLTLKVHTPASGRYSSPPPLCRVAST